MTPRKVHEFPIGLTKPTRISGGSTMTTTTRGAPDDEARPPAEDATASEEDLLSGSCLLQPTNNETRWIESEEFLRLARPKGRPSGLSKDHHHRSNNNDPEDHHHHHHLLLLGDEKKELNQHQPPDQKDNEEEEEEDWGWMHQIFADPDPMDTFVYTFQIPSSSSFFGTMSSSPAQRTLRLTLRGYKAELGSTLSSTGLTVWRAAEALCDYLVVQPPPPQPQQQAPFPRPGPGDRVRAPEPHQWWWRPGQKVLELGAGLGLCGLLAHHLGAPHVVLTDGDTETLKHLRRNVHLRGRAPGEQESGDDKDNDDDDELPRGTLHCRQLVWGSPVVEDLVQEYGSFDLVMGSDLIYVEQVIQPLFQTVQQTLAYPHGRFLLAYCHRHVSIDHVLALAPRYGLTWQAPGGDDLSVEGVLVFTHLPRSPPSS